MRSSSRERLASTTARDAITASPEPGSTATPHTSSFWVGAARTATSARPMGTAIAAMKVKSRRNRTVATDGRHEARGVFSISRPTGEPGHRGPNAPAGIVGPRRPEL